MIIILVVRGGGAIFANCKSVPTFDMNKPTPAVPILLAVIISPGIDTLPPAPAILPNLLATINLACAGLVKSVEFLSTINQPLTVSN